MIEFYKDNELKCYISNEAPYIEIKLSDNNKFTKVQIQLITLLAVDICLMPIHLFEYGILDTIEYIKALSFNELYKICIEYSAALIPCFLIEQKLITNNIMESYLNTDDFFLLLDNRFLRASLDMQNFYKKFLTSKTIIKNPDIFSIKIFQYIVKYPNFFIEKYFDRFEWNDEIQLSNKKNIVLNFQQPTFDILLKNIDKLNSYEISHSSFLEKEQKDTLLLLKQML